MEYDIKRGNIFYVSRTPVVGHEQFAGRPAIIVSSDAINEHAQIVEVVYLTTQQKSKTATHVPIRSSKYPSIALCEQVTTVSVDRLGDRLGSCTEDEMRAVNMALMESVGLAHVLRGGGIAYVQSAPQENAVAVANAERDVYKAMYEQLLSKVVQTA